MIDLWAGSMFVCVRGAAVFENQCHYLQLSFILVLLNAGGFMFYLFTYMKGLFKLLVIA